MAISSVFLFTIAERTLRSGVASELRVCQLLSDALGCFLSNLTGIIDTDQSLSEFARLDTLYASRLALFYSSVTKLSSSPRSGLMVTDFYSLAGSPRVRAQRG
jgi:hypothetical protein